MRILKETRKEDDVYYEGPFWLVSDSFEKIMINDFDLLSIKIECDYNGNRTDSSVSKRSMTHQSAWKDIKNKYDFAKDKPMNYYPRGRVAIYNGVAYIHLNSKCNAPGVINRIEREYNLDKLKRVYDFNDTYQGSHYEFLLK